MIVQSGLRKSIEVTWGTSGLFARADIYDDSSGTPALDSTAVLTELSPGTYVGSFIPVASKSYVVVKRVYTDNTYSTPDLSFPPSSEAFQCIDFSQAGSGSGTADGQAITAVIGQQPVLMIVGD